MSDDVTFLSQLMREYMELQAQEALERSDGKEPEIMKSLQVWHINLPLAYITYPMEINWIVTIYWLMEAGKGYRFIRYIYCYNQIMVQMEMSKPWTHPWWTWNGRISWVFWNRKELPGEYMRISTHCCSLLPSPQLLLLSYRGYDAAGNSVYPCMRWDKDSYRFSRATSLRGTEISWLSSSGPPLPKDVGCKSISESVNS